jgi:hypothetical protein
VPGCAASIVSIDPCIMPESLEGVKARHPTRRREGWQGIALSSLGYRYPLLRSTITTRSTPRARASFLRVLCQLLPKVEMRHFSP